MFGFRKKIKWPEANIEEIKKRSNILVVDDTEFVYKQLFERDGYTIHKWNDVEKLEKIENNYYDVILLDIQGVGKEYSSEEGLGILRHIHEVSPTQIVIAYSNADFSLKYHEFFKTADATLAKSDEYYKFKRTVDKLLLKRFSIDFYIDRIVKIAGPQTTDKSKLKELARDALFDCDRGKFEKFLKDHEVNIKTMELVMQVVQVGLTVATAI